MSRSPRERLLDILTSCEVIAEHHEVPALSHAARRMLAVIDETQSQERAD